MLSNRSWVPWAPNKCLLKEEQDAGSEQLRNLLSYWPLELLFPKSTKKLGNEARIWGVTGEQRQSFAPRLSHPAISPILYIGKQCYRSSSVSETDQDNQLLVTISAGNACKKSHKTFLVLP